MRRLPAVTLLAAALLAAALLAVAPCAATAAPGPGDAVLAAGAEAAMLAALAPEGRPLAEGAALLGAAIEHDRVLVRFGAGGVATLAVTLVHPDAASPAARPAGPVAIELRPGPAPAALVDALAARLRGADIPWTRLPPAPAAPPGGSPRRSPNPGPSPDPSDSPASDPDLEPVRRALLLGDEVAARALLAQLRVAASPDSPSPALRPELQLELALLHAQVGDAEAAAALVAGLTDPVLGLAGAAVRGQRPPPPSAGELRPGDACRYVAVAETLRRMGHPQDAQRWAEAITTAAPACHGAVVGLVAAQMANRRPEAALATAEAALAGAPRDPTFEALRVDALRHLGRLAEATAALEARVHAGRNQPGDLQVLMAMYLQRGAVPEQLPKWRARAAERGDGDDLVARFMVGVMLHYTDAFAESSAWLEPLLEPLAAEPRMYVYLGMNAFNLGDVERARSLLEHGVSLEALDPDVYYCRAEVVRDTERALAIADLRRYAAVSGQSGYANPEKEARVAAMIAALEACEADGVARCEGPWEHPRPVVRRWLVRHALPVGAAGGAAGLALVAWLVIRRRRRRRA